MNATPDPATLLPAPPSTPDARQEAQATRRRRPVARLVSDILLGKAVTLILAGIALALGVATFAVMAGGTSLPFRPNVVYGLVLANAIVLLVLGAVVAGQLTRVWVERRRGSAGARLHVRLVLLFGVVAVVPSIVVAVFATAFFHLGIDVWFNDRVRTALEESLQVSQGYLDEHRNNIRADALAMANDLTRLGPLMSENPDAFARVLATQTGLRGLTEAVIFDPFNDQVMASAGPMSQITPDRAPADAIAIARSGDVALIDSADGTQVRAVVQLNMIPTLMLLIERPIDPSILAHATQTQQAVAEYERLAHNRSGLEVAFAVVFALVALLVLSAAALIGLVMANQIARPVGRLILATERVRAGDLGVRVPEQRDDDEIAGLSRAFNRMTGQLSAQRTELMDAYGQIDERRRFTETVLSGVSAGVIGLDGGGGIELPNRAASDLLGIDLMAHVGDRLADLVPEFAPLIAEAEADPVATPHAEVQVGPATRRRTLLVRIGTERRAGRRGESGGESGDGRANGRADGAVVTFDDITELESAQRKAAWADVARRIAHEIKNPLTPIQLSAERMKRRFAKEITSDPETFAQCADTIVRHVEDIGRMVDEFSAFARMPQPVIRPEDIGRAARETLVLQRSARPHIAFETAIPVDGPVAPCDRRLLGQALTNLLQNAADAVAMRPGAGRIALSVGDGEGEAWLRVTDDGVGLPQADRQRLTEPYVTHKPKGTGLGLAIVKKIMEDHGGRLELEDRQDGPGAIATLVLPARSAPIG